MKSWLFSQIWDCLCRPWNILIMRIVNLMIWSSAVELKSSNGAKHGSYISVMLRPFDNNAKSPWFPLKSPFEIVPGFHGINVAVQSVEETPIWRTPPELPQNFSSFSNMHFWVCRYSESFPSRISHVWLHLKRVARPWRRKKCTSSNEQHPEQCSKWTRESSSIKGELLEKHQTIETFGIKGATWF